MVVANASDDRAKWGKILGVAGVGALAIYAAPKALAYLNRGGRLTHLFNEACEVVDHTVGWDRLPAWLGVLDLVGVRHILREKNLYDTATPGAPPPVPPPPPDENYRTVRTPDGTYNDLDYPLMGSAGTRFGRNAPIAQTYPDKDEDLLRPSPRTVSRELMTRHQFQPATTLNVLAGAWLQFMIRDWFSHGKSPKDNPWQIPLEEGDDWHEDPMRIMRTRPDPTRSAADEGQPPTYTNTETHWWDASQLYGSNLEYQQTVRTGVDGKMRLDQENLVNIPQEMLVQQANVAGWWLGMALLFTLFTLEHNAVCDRLKKEYPDWDDEALFQHARLIIAALLAKIHTVEWTTGILGHPALQIAMRANWWGIAGEQIHKMLGRISSNEVISGIPGGKKDHFGVPYSITEEFVGVYKMHPLVPDDYVIRSAKDDRLLGERVFAQVAGQHVETVLGDFKMGDLLYSFGRAHPGAIVLHNFPRGLQRFERPDGIVVDLASHDILRSRELGVPRYNQFRRMLHLKPFNTFEEMTDNPEWAEEIKRVYEGDIERVDLSVGLFAEKFPAGFGFSDTAFRIFVLMASRRLNSDRFFTTDFTPEVYTPVGMKWIDDNTMGTVLLRHFPELAPALRGVGNAFAPWNRAG